MLEWKVQRLVYLFICRAQINEFLQNEDVKHLFAYTKAPRQLVTSLSAPVDPNTKFVIFVKNTSGVKLTKENIGKHCLPSASDWMF